MLMNIVLIGAGYVGTALLRRMIDLPYEVCITTTREEKIETLKPYGKEVLLLKDHFDDRLQNWLLSCDALIVLVAPGSSGNYEKTYLETAKTIAAVLKKRKNRLHLIYTSSTSVCEGTDAEWLTEEMELSPLSENGKILLETEKVYLQSNADACILRLGGIYGPQRELIDRARRLSGKQMGSSGDEPTNHVHLDDIIHAILFCLDHRLKGIYHLVNDDHPTRKELYGSLAASIDVPSPIWTSNAQNGYRVSSQKIKEAGFAFRHPRLSH
jgi:nucleoside-diphosphate-sugar epimerase